MGGGVRILRGRGLQSSRPGEDCCVQLHVHSRRFPTATHAPHPSRCYGPLSLPPPPPVRLLSSLAYCIGVRLNHFTSHLIHRLPELERKIATRRILSVVWAWNIVSTLLPLTINGYDPGYKIDWRGYVVLIAQIGPGEDCWPMVRRRLR